MKAFDQSSSEASTSQNTLDEPEYLPLVSNTSTPSKERRVVKYSSKVSDFYNRLLSSFTRIRHHNGPIMNPQGLIGWFINLTRSTYALPAAGSVTALVSYVMNILHIHSILIPSLPFE